MTPQFAKFKETLEKVFMLDQADLDFGIYRIMNQKRKEIETYLNTELQEQVKAILSANSNDKRKDLEKELAERSKTLRENGIDPSTSPKIKELEEKLAVLGGEEDLEAEVYSHLATFFGRYYSEGDFISQRRYKKDTYSIPYEGEEVKLYWANADQYFIKTSEYFKLYSFKLSDGKIVKFVLVDATTEQNNNKAQGDFERRFALLEENSLEVIDNELHIFFTYDLYPKSTKQSALIDRAFDRLKDIIPSDFIEVFSFKPTEKDKTRTLLEKHLNDYVSRNTFDYFIHKDLKGFLSRELDFYLKNELLFIDDLEEAETRVQAYLSVLKAVKGVGNKIITFLASLEGFQKRLWEKKKFIYESNYCLTLDRVPESLYKEITLNSEQRKEWVKLFEIDKIKGEEGNVFGDGNVGYSEPLTVEFLQQNTYLVLDTAYFDENFKHRLLQSIENIDESIDGLLIASENFQGLSLIKDKYANAVDLQYIDPPFNLNTNADYPYSTNYKDSTWLSLLANRHTLSMDLMKDNGVYFVRCDYHGNHFVRMLLDSEGLDYKTEIMVKRSRNEAGSTKMDVTHEYLYLYGKPNIDIEKYKVDRSVADIKWTGFLMAGDRRPPERVFLGKTIFPPTGQHFSLVQNKVDRLLDENHLRLRCRKCGCYYFKAKSTEELARRMKNKQEKYKYYDILPTTSFYGVQNLEKCVDCDCEEFTVQYLGAPEEFINDNWLDISSYSKNWGFATENAEECLERVVKFTKEGDLVLDYFVGSGTTAATAKKMGRKWIGIDMAEYINDITLPRMKVVYSGKDKSGIKYSKDISRGGIFRYLRLESYEDTLNNLVLHNSAEQSLALENAAAFNESYLLGYLLDMEAKESLFSSDWFVKPFDVKMKITRQNEMREETIDLVDTFNYLIGLNVEHISYPRDGICTVKGVTSKGESTLIIWRDCSKIDNATLNDFFKRRSISAKDSEYDRIYVNGDSNLENMRTDEEHWKVSLIEETFSKKMFEG